MWKSQSFPAVIRQAVALSREFALVDPKPWPPEIKVLDLQHIVGNVARLVLEREGFKPSSSAKHQLAEELALIFFISADLADTYRLDLEWAVLTLLNQTARHLNTQAKRRKR